MKPNFYSVFVGPSGVVTVEKNGSNVTLRGEPRASLWLSLGLIGLTSRDLECVITDDKLYR